MKKIKFTIALTVFMVIALIYVGVTKVIAEDKNQIETSSMSIKGNKVTTSSETFEYRNGTLYKIETPSTRK